ncbi:hypothetical protein BN977_03859 [Mycolicibacterium cosmeticum]|uniref:Secreted protein n=1 Tax=Mycolicibacterium cosmeticum TaxID=258533 RepID=W9ATD9_MYCCO|nr:hypothetical protein BN977_03859 [Mycolicibacterium cosmeticum]
MITAKVSMVIICMLRSPAMCWSAISADGPVTNTFSPGGGVIPSMIFWVASTDSLASDSPWLPAR